MNNYTKLREWLADMEHQQWEYWSKSIAEEIIHIKELASENRYGSITQITGNRLERWNKNWKPYSKLDEDTKDFDRVWADKILDELPFKCPVYQCGGFMVAKELPYPKGMNEDDFPDGMAGDFQTPDLVCKNCKSVYHFVESKKGTNQRLRNVPLAVNKKEDGLPPTSKEVGIRPTIL